MHALFNPHDINWNILYVAGACLVCFPLFSLRLVRVGIAGLLRSEAERVHVEAWLPSMERYVKVNFHLLY